MVRLLFETSLPARTLRGVAALLEAERLPPGVRGRFGMGEQLAGCESPARGGDQDWTPCWVSLEAETTEEGFFHAIRAVRQAVVEAAREGGIELFAIPASAQIGEGYHRMRDLLDVLEFLD